MKHIQDKVGITIEEIIMIVSELKASAKKQNY